MANIKYTNNFFLACDDRTSFDFLLDSFDPSEVKQARMFAKVKASICTSRIDKKHLAGSYQRSMRSRGTDRAKAARPLRRAIHVS